jgi:hypothetical protein
MATLDLSVVGAELEYYVKAMLENVIDNLIELYADVANIATSDKRILDSFAEWIKNELECEVSDER